MRLRSLGNASPVRYQGIDQLGLARRGSIFTTDLAGFVQTRYRQGWRSLTVDRSGVKIGTVGRLGPWSCWWAVSDNGQLRGECAIDSEAVPMD